MLFKKQLHLFLFKNTILKKDIFLCSRCVTVDPFYHKTMITSKAKMCHVEILFLMQVPLGQSF